MGSKPSSLNKTDPMATNLENRRDLRGIREQDRQQVASTEHAAAETEPGAVDKIPPHTENPALSELRAEKGQR